MEVMASAEGADCALCASLQVQVTALEAKLGEVHCANANSLKRAHASLRQHVDALEAELAQLRPLAGSIAVVFVDCASLTNDAATLAAGVTLGFWGHRLIALEPAAPFWLRVLPWIVSLGAATARIALANEARFASQTRANKSTRMALLDRLRVCEERVAIMRALMSPTGDD